MGMSERVFLSGLEPCEQASIRFIYRMRREAGLGCEGARQGCLLMLARWRRAGRGG